MKGCKKIFKHDFPVIVAEMSGNHNGSLDRAKEIISSAAEAGADAIKFQTYTPDTITLDCNSEDFQITDSKSLWYGRNLYDLYREAHTPYEWHEELFSFARKKGIIPFSAPFDFTSVDLLESLGCEMYKIASLEITHLPLIKKVAQTRKPMIISTGLASESEIFEAIHVAKENGAEDITLLKCTSAYPADASDANLITIPDMMEKFGVKVGLSDHTLGIGVSLASIVYGASVIEKHFTLDRNDGGVDSEFSLNPSELKALKEESVRVYKSRGEVRYGGTENEKNSFQFRQSIYPCKPIKKGEYFTEENLKICRPGYSLEPKFWNEILGKTSRRSYDIGEKIKRSEF